jgi:hypothetical protein
MTLTRLFCTGGAVVAVLAATLGAALAAPASAGPVTARVAAAAAPTRPHALPAVLPSAGLGPATQTAIAPADVITCTVNVQNPHNSSHVGGTVNVISTILCTGAMSGLAQYVGLYYNNVLVGEAYNSNSGVASLTGNFATACKSGTYVGASSYLEVAPAGYVPAYTEGEANSNVVSITC